MAETFEGRDLAGATFRNIDMHGARFEGAWLKDARIAHSCLRGVRMTDVDVGGLTIDGIRVDRLLEAELDRRDPRRAALRLADTHDPAEVRRAVAVLEEVRETFRARLRAASAPQLLFKPEDRRWGAIDHLRHMLFAEEIYTNRWMLRSAVPFSPMGLRPHFLLGKEAYAGVGTEPATAADDLEGLLAAWDAVHARTRAFLADLTKEKLQTSVRDVSFGQRDVGAVFATLTGHDLHHVRLAEAALEAFAAAEGGTKPRENG